jgi:tetratricopeptide (TPR) repeat protein
MAEIQPDEIARLEKLFFSNPEGRVFTHLAEAYRKVGDLDRARQVLEDGLRRHEGYASAHVVFGRVLNGLGEREAAMREFGRVLELDPENRIALQSLAEHAQRHDRPDEALDYLRRLAQLDPSDEDVQGAIARLERDAASRAEPPQERMWEYGYAVEDQPPVQEPEAPQHARPDPVQPHEDLMGSDVGRTAGTTASDSDPFATLNGDWAGGAPESAEPHGAGEAAAIDTGAEPWPDLDASDVPALRFDWGLTPLDAGEGPPDEADAQAQGAGDDAAQWLTAANADWDAPAGLEFAPDSAHAPEPDETAAGHDRDGELGAMPYDVMGDEGVYNHETGAAPFDPIDGGELLPDAAETEVYTETLADLYRAQGFPERAIGVYRSLLADRPGDERLTQKLREMEGRIDETQHAAGDLRAAEQWNQIADDVARASHEEPDDSLPSSDTADGGARSDSMATATAEAERPAAALQPHEADAGDDEHGADTRWIEGVESAWTGREGATDDAATPYAWTGAGEEEEADAGSAPAGPSIRAVLGALLAWRPARSDAAEPEEELLLLDELDAEPDIAAQFEDGGQAADMPAAAVPAVAPVDYDDSAAEPESAPPEVPELEPAGEFAAAAPGESDEPYVPMPWEEEDGADDPWSEAPAAAPPSEVDAGLAEPPHAATAGGAEEHGRQPALFDPGSAAGGAAAGRQADDTDEDDDLELFRSWLQSLKK